MYTHMYYLRGLKQNLAQILPFVTFVKILNFAGSQFSLQKKNGNFIEPTL